MVDNVFNEDQTIWNDSYVRGAISFFILMKR